jgi:AmmeMemoRadiSam system protein B
MMTDRSVTSGLKPRIRGVQLIPYVYDGRPSYLVRDPLQLNGHTLIIPEILGPVVFVCDGHTGLTEISDRLMTLFGLQTDRAELEAILAAFDEVYLLENDRYHEARANALASYRTADFRPAVSAGGSYPMDPAELHHLLQDLLESVDVEPDDEPVAGILSPHIDYARGGPIYAGIWKRAAASIAAADLIVVIGTDHYGDHPITLTRQHYATPFGVLPTDIDVVDRLAEALGEEAAFSGELFHRVEHSLELPLVWLHHLAGNRPLPIVPILCGNFDPDSPRLTGFVEALKNVVKGRRVFTVISGDLAHVGPAFGGAPQSAADRRAVHEADDFLLDRLAEGDAAGFLAGVQATRNANNICGVYPLYLGATAFGYRRGERFGYDQCRADDQDESFVSIGGISFK